MLHCAASLGSPVLDIHLHILQDNVLLAGVVVDALPPRLGPVAVVDGDGAGAGAGEVLHLDLLGRVVAAGPEGVRPLGPEDGDALQERPQRREGAGDDADAAFDDGPDDDVADVVWGDGAVSAWLGLRRRRSLDLQ